MSGLAYEFSLLFAAAAVVADEEVSVN